MTEQSTAEALFFSALEKSTPEARAAFLDAACGEDYELRRRVERLLAAQPQVGSFLEPAAASVSEHTVPYQPGSEAAGSVIAGRYKLLEALGEGGMGTVFMAQQIEPVKRLVALKVINPGMDSRHILARFEAERQALALMDHPNIAKVLDGGLTEQDRPFFVMELVKGVPITRYCDERKLSPRERLELFVPVCLAIQHAHQKGVIHRDIKPGNVLVALYDGLPVPKVIDFGVAKAAGQQLTDATLVTGFGAVIGTPEYMSPEQAELNQLDIDTRSDVYALGVLLYELLTGTTPLDRKRFGQAALLEILRVVREEEPPRPSTRLSTSEALPSIAAARRTEPAKLAGLVRGELDWIVMKCLEKERRRRYETANGLAQDIQRFLADEPVEACPPSSVYRLRKFARRNKGPLAAAALVLAALLVGTVGVTWQAGERKREQAERRSEQEVVETRARQAVQLQLDLAESGLQVHKLGEVDGAITQAELSLADFDAPDLHKRLAVAKKDLAMVRRLDDAFAWRWNLAKGQIKLFPQKAAELYPAALREYGLAIGEEPAASTVQTIRRSTIAEAIRVALEQWFFLEPSTSGLRDVLEEDDPDSVRSEIRVAVAAGQADRVRQLAEKADQSRLSEAFAIALGMYLPIEESPRLMKFVWGRHPDSFPIAMAIAARLTELDIVQGTTAAEAVGWGRMAVALRPESAFAHHCLGVALGEAGDKEGMNAELREAIRLAPRFARAASLMAFDFYYKQDKREEALVLYQSLVHADPGSAPGHAGLCRYYAWKGQWAEAATACLALYDALEDPKYNGLDSCFDHSTSVGSLDRHEDVISGFVAERRLDEAIQFGHRMIHNHTVPGVWPRSTCAAALLAVPEKSEPLSETDIVRIRQTAFEWLSEGIRKADESHRKEQSVSDVWVEDLLKDARLDSVRDETSLAKLPVGEQEQWRKLWRDARALRDRTAPSKSPDQP